MVDTDAESTPMVDVGPGNRDHNAQSRTVTRKSDSISRSSNQTIKRRMLTQFLEWWLEISAIVLSLISFTAIVVTLVPHNGRPLPEWPYSISVNSLLSIYILVFKAGIVFAVAEALSQLKWLWYKRQHNLVDADVFDQAVRGPWGALRLLRSIAPRNMLAGTGAIAIVLMVMVDPFAQQLLAYYDCAWPIDSGQAAVGRTSFLEDLGPDSWHIAAGINSIPASWRQGLLAGALGVELKMPFSCSTGNCTLPGIYTTMGFCSSCSDISSELSITNETITQTLNNKTYQSWTLNSSLPSGFQTSNGPPFEPMNWTAMHTRRDLGNPTIEIMMPMAPDHAFRTTYDQYNTSCTSGNPEDVWRCRGYGAAKCSLNPCVQRLSGQVVAGVLNETVLETYDGPWGIGNGSSNWMPAVLDLNCTTAQEKSILATEGYTFTANQSWLPYNLSWDLGYKLPSDIAFPKSLEARGCIYAYSAYVAMSLDYGFESNTLFAGQLSGYWGGEVDVWDLSGPEMLQQCFNYGNISFQRISGIFANMSNSMTTLTRQKGNVNSSAPVVGLVTRHQTCLEVRWAWLIFPAVLAAIAWSFFIAALTMQHKTGWIPTWKSSSLPMLLRNTIPADAGDVLAESDNTGDQIGGLTMAARRSRVQLGGHPIGLVLAEKY